MSDTGRLLAYDNTRRWWLVLGDEVTDTFDTVEAISIGDGTGAGTNENSLYAASRSVVYKWVEIINTVWGIYREKRKTPLYVIAI
jgi:hypothetical protein